MLKDFGLPSVSITNKVTRNIGVLAISLNYLRMEWLFHMENLCLNFYENAKLFKKIVQFNISTHAT